ncbi:hypothetical protein NKI61_23580 [Mesorhizobium sp. M0514]|uniref:hypothetical protein n=1 Tax=Mesorhizobium sp. M0514 TaxID=2956955 RepID=UPI00333AF516
MWGPGIGIGIRNDVGDLVEGFDKAIVGAVNAGTLKKLSPQWFGFDLSPPPAH